MMVGSNVFQNSTSQAMVRVSSTAWCCASGESAMIRSKEVSSNSSKVFGLWPDMSTPISFITSTIIGSVSPCRAPTEST
jgi:hypothetical protein